MQKIYHLAAQRDLGEASYALLVCMPCVFRCGVGVGVEKLKTCRKKALAGNVEGCRPQAAGVKSNIKSWGWQFLTAASVHLTSTPAMLAVTQASHKDDHILLG